MLAWLRQSRTRASTICISIVLNSLQYGFHCLFHASKERQAKPLSTARPAPLLDYTYAPYSPAIVTSQNLAMMASIPFCQSLLHYGGVNTADMTFKLIMCAVAGLYSRVTFALAQWPLRLFGIADSRRTESDRRGIALAFLSTRSCCLDRDTNKLQKAVQRMALLRSTW